MTNSNILTYQSEDGQTKIQTRLEDETVWLTQAQLCELFQKSKSTISEHIKNIFEDEELEENQVVRNLRTTANDGKNYKKRTKNSLSNVEKDFLKTIDTTAKKLK